MTSDITNNVSPTFEPLSCCIKNARSLHICPDIQSSNHDTLGSVYLILNEDLYRIVDEHNSLHCKICDIHDIVINSMGLEMLSINIRSITAHFEDLEALLIQLNYPDIVAISETWLNEINKNLCSLCNYKCIL